MFDPSLALTQEQNARETAILHKKLDDLQLAVVHLTALVESLQPAKKVKE